MDHDTMNALWIYWARGDDEVELTDKKSYDSNDEDEFAKILGSRLIWKDDGYCNGGNLPEAYIDGNTLRYQDLEWYEALKDCKLKEEAFKNKAIMGGMIDEDDESSNEGWRRWDDFDNTNHDNEESENEMEHKDEERCEVFYNHERPICYIRRFEMVKYSFRDDKDYVAIKENEYDDLTNTRKEATHAYHEIFCMMDEGWMIVSIVGSAGDPWDQRVRSQLIGKDLVSGLLVYEFPLSRKTGNVYNSATNSFYFTEEEWKELNVKTKNKANNLRNSPLLYPDLCTYLCEKCAASGPNRQGFGKRNRTPLSSSHNPVNQLLQIEDVPFDEGGSSVPPPTVACFAIHKFIQRERLTDEFFPLYDHGEVHGSSNL
ncbi:hypothetical protein Tco_0750680 [Tanacetum coccineum]|uniref:Uncharacterized protein n=1 Tax=Tanacetum coccineum TaxID=301880 RepID=A0ABQ4Z1X1_9ASTR